MGEDSTTIRINRTTWGELDDRKGSGETFDGVIQDLLDAANRSPNEAEPAVVD